MRALAVLLLLAGPLLAGCLAPVVPTDALADPPAPVVLSWTRVLYDFGTMVVSDRESNIAYPVPLRGSIHHPTEGEGPFPLVVFQHGRHATCGVAGWEVGFVPAAVCAQLEPVVAPIPSFAGYDYIAEPLAARGYVVVSVDANEINNRDALGPVVQAPLGLPLRKDTGDEGIQARAQLLLRTLDELARLHASPGEPVGDALVGKLDLSRIGLMGHSRGAEGVTMALELNEARAPAERHAIRAVFALAAADRNRVYATNAAWLSLLPSCDGDVVTLGGASVYDRSRYLPERAPSPKIQVLALGANHNFYNTVWTGDDAWWDGDPYCAAPHALAGPGAGRLGMADQQRQGLALIAGFFRHHLGGEPEFGPWFSGAADPPAAACPMHDADCADRILVSYHAAAPQRKVLEDTADAATLLRNDLGGASRFTGFAALRTCDARACPAQPTAGLAHLLRVAWDGPAAWSLEIPQGQGDLRGYDALTVRAGVDFSDARNPRGESQDFRLVLRDGAGREAAALASDHTHALYDPPGTDSRRSVLNMVRVPLGAFSEVDLADVREVRLAFDATPRGALLLADLLVQADG